MITGFNTDVEHEGVVYHVQTEDKGLETPLILSLVYTGGAILASKRARYDDLIAAGFDEKLLADRLQRQHKLICAAIRAGRIEDLKKMSGRENPSRAAKKVEAEEEEPLQVIEEPLELMSPAEVSLEIELTGPYEPIPPPPIPAPPVDSPPTPPAPRRRGDSTRKLVPPVEKPAPPVEKPALSAEKHLPPPRRIAPRATRAPAQKRATDFVPHGAAINELHLGLIDEKNYRGGDRINLRVHVAGGLERRMPVNDAEVIVKILGSTFRPLILQSKTGPDGIATFIIQLPHFRSGRAAILVRATSDSHEAELRRIIQQG